MTTHFARDAEASDKSVEQIAEALDEPTKRPRTYHALDVSAEEPFNASTETADTTMLPPGLCAVIQRDLHKRKFAPSSGRVVFAGSN